MKTRLLSTLLLAFSVAWIHAAGSPVKSSAAFKGRIACSADGNHNDPDDWIASPVTLAIFAETGLKDRLVHFDYNCILPQTDPEFERKHEESVLGTAERYGYERARFMDCRKELDRVVDDIARVINESSSDNPLWFIIAGPMEVPYLGIQKSDPAKRRFVTCISHSRWNDGFASHYTFTHTKRSVIEQDVSWVQIRDQNKLLSLSPYGRPAQPQEFAGYFWMRDSDDAKVRWLWDRMLVSTRPDPSDAGMSWFLTTGDEDCDPAKLKHLIEEHQMPGPTVRKQVRLEAENFRHLDGFSVEDRKDKKASHLLEVALEKDEGRIRTRLAEPYAPQEGRCDLDVRFLDEMDKHCHLVLLINGSIQGEAWESPGEGKGWTTHTVRGLTLRLGDEITVEAKGGPAKLDYVQLNFGETGGADASPAVQKPLRVAVVQMFLRSTLEENRDRIVAGIGQTAEKGARVAVFPERALSGRGGEPEAVVNDAVNVIRSAAKKHGISVVFGANTRLASVKKDANWMLAIGPDGSDLMRYEKIYDNHRATMPGVFQVDGVPCSTMICADRWLRGVVELPILEGAQINFELSNNHACEWVPEYGWYWNVPLALRNTVWSIFANAGNRAPGVAETPRALRHGHSVIVAPDGKVVASASDDAETMVVADIDPAQAIRAGSMARAANPALHAFWDAGLKLHRGETIERVAFKPLTSKETDITLATSSVTGDFTRMESLIREARERKADLVAFPAQSFSEEMLERLRIAARQNEITVVAGAKHREGDKLCNSAFVIGPDGEVLTRYDQLSAEAPFHAGANAAAMWFRIKGAAAFVTIGVGSSRVDLQACKLEYSIVSPK